ncbi:sn-glycerol-1-phosphate dehydrogenase [Bacillus sp. UMB0899]|nr:sn-glycerol-1-phosphate dehydrogenase [Bacillus sp. UMB0899]
MITLNELKKQSKACQCGNQHYDVVIEKVVISHHALTETVTYISEKNFQHVAVIADSTTFNVAGERLTSLLKEANINHQVVVIQPNEQGDVVADEVSLIEAMLGIPQETDVVIAVGAGTIHDITRFSSYKMGKPFISVPTAPSVDGFNSMGAPVVIKGMKTTYQMQTPIALFADISILQGAPKEMIAAGFGDMIGKHTSLADWTFSHLVNDEPYCPLSARLTREAMNECENHVNEIARGDSKGIQILIEALIQSGYAMLIVGHSSPASGGEHHLSHFWEMNFLQQQKPQVLHGAKVGVSSQVILDLYKKSFKELVANKQQLEALPISQKDKMMKVIEHQDEILTVIASLPESTYIADQLEKLGGAVKPIDLGIDDELVQESRKKAHHIRSRYTMLKFWNEHIGASQHA